MDEAMATATSAPAPTHKEHEQRDFAQVMWDLRNQPKDQLKQWADQVDEEEEDANQHFGSLRSVVTQPTPADQTQGTQGQEPMSYAKLSLMW